jgi:hypothetical protein
MNQIRFRSEDEWKAALLTLPDNVYFDLMRSVFGNIKTPFNKHRLMDDLVSFLSRRETQEIITAYIDETDLRIITAIVALGEPAPGDLESLFSGEYSYLDIHGMLLNLEERLLVYRFREDGIYHLALNPILEPIFAPYIMDKSILLPSIPLNREEGAETGTQAVVLPDDRLLATLLAFVLDEGEIFKSEGGLRKKVLDDGKRIFPSLDVERLIGGLYNINIFSAEGNRLIPDTRRLTIFRELSPRERREYWAGGIYNYCQDSEIIVRYSHLGRTQKLAQFIHRFISTLDPGRVYPQTTLKRLMVILEKDETGNPRWAEVGIISLTIGAAGIDVFLEALKTVGLIAPAAPVACTPDTVMDSSATETPDVHTTADPRIAPAVSDFWRPVPVSPGGETPGPVIAMDTAFSCILYPEIAFSDALILAAFCSARETGTLVRFELTRESVIRGFDLGLDAPAIIGHLERLSGKSIDQNLRWTLQEWGNRYSSVALYRGAVLVLAEDRRYLAQAEPIASLIVRTLGPGVYLLHETDQAVQGLQRAGVDIIAQPPLPEQDAPDESWVHPKRTAGAKAPFTRLSSPYPHLRALPLFPNAAFKFRQSGRAMEAGTATVQEWAAGHYRAVFKDAVSYQERFRQALRKLSLPKTEMDELTARIDRRLILNESQLAGGAVRNEKTEARNLDYVGKTMVAKQAIALKSLVEAVWVTPEGESCRLMGIPGALEKWGGETVLSLKTIPEGNDVRLPLGKISLLRRIKQSIFGE